MQTVTHKTGRAQQKEVVTMISAISTASMILRPSQTNSLTEDQSTKLTDTLANYDADNLSDDDAKALVSAIKEMGITAGSGLTDALAGAGIDARELADQAGIGGGGPSGAGGPPGGAGGPPGGGGPGGPGGGGGGSAVSEVDEAVLSLVQEAVDSYAESDTEESFADILAAKLTENGYDSSQPIVDFYA